MKIKYVGPCPFVRVKGFGLHEKGETKEYPDADGEKLLKTSKRQTFEKVPEAYPQRQRVPKKKTQKQTNEEE